MGRAEDEIRIDAEDALGAIEGLEVRRVFSGWGFYRRGLLFAAAWEGEFRFRTRQGRRWIYEVADRELLTRPDELVSVARGILARLEAEPAAARTAGDASGGEPGPPVWLAGNVGGAWRIGGTVHRPVGPWTPAVHALLGFLAPRLDHIPAVVGFDEEGREVLTFLPGRVVDVDTEPLTLGQIDSLVSWTRCFHEVVAGFSHPGPWRYPHVAHASLIGHNDIAPYNVCFDGDDVAGVFDWDLAGPTTPLMELAFIAWNCVPLWRDTGDEACAERIQRICSAYGGVDPVQLVDAVPPRIQMMLDWIPAGAAAGDAGLRRLMGQGEPGRSQAALNDLIPRLRRIRLLLG